MFYFSRVFSNEMVHNPVIIDLDFNDLKSGAFSHIENDDFVLDSENGVDRILSKGGRISSQCLFITGGKDHVVELAVKKTTRSIRYISFKGQRLSDELPFILIVESLENNQWVNIYQADSIFPIDQFSENISIPVSSTSVKKIRFRCTSPDKGGVLLDDLVLLDHSSMWVEEVNRHGLNLPVLINKEVNPIHKVSVICNGEHEAKVMTEIGLGSTDMCGKDMVKSIQIFYTGSNPEFNTKQMFGEKINPKGSFQIQGNQQLHHGVNNFWISVTVHDNCNLRSTLHTIYEDILISDIIYPPDTGSSFSLHRMGIALRDHNDEGVHTYRIPGLVTTNKGNLIAVYDIRRNGPTDLQADIDVGMSRSTDGGQSWEDMKVIMDMGEWADLSEDQNGIGDPSILVDRETNTIWVAGVWAHGHKNRRNWIESKPGLDPHKTSQLMLVKSEDDGITWSEPINITSQIKRKEWHLLLQGPGKGITLSDGKLVFPAQFKNEEEVPYSTIIWSDDHGSNWEIGAGAKSNTTEAQVIELNDGSLMLNMRDNRNKEDKSDTNGRSVAITKDMGKNWEVHPSSKSTLIEPVCMASLIKEQFEINGASKSIVLFSNPASMYYRKDISIKLSFDDGETWPSRYFIMLDEGTGRGYSCMTKIDENHIGILYESSRADLVFQVINIEDIILKAEEQ
jgi:sialidase-1